MGNYMSDNVNTFRIEDVEAEYDQVLNELDNLMNSKIQVFLSIFNNKKMIELTDRLLELQNVLSNYNGQLQVINQVKSQDSGLKNAIGFNCTCSCGRYDAPYFIEMNGGLCRECATNGVDTSKNEGVEF